MLLARGNGLRGRMREHFDGFRSLKLIHALRDSGFENLPLAAALEEASFVPPLPAQTAPLCEAASDHLEAQEYPIGPLGVG